MQSFSRSSLASSSCSRVGSNAAPCKAAVFPLRRAQCSLLSDAVSAVHKAATTAALAIAKAAGLPMRYTRSVAAQAGSPDYRPRATSSEQAVIKAGQAKTFELCQPLLTLHALRTSMPGGPACLVALHA